jgi:beta-glucanase (GH16 family)
MRRARRQFKIFESLLTALFLMVLLVIFVPVSGNEASAAEWDKPGYVLTFQDEFDGTSLDYSKWNDWDLNFSTRGPGIVGSDSPVAICPDNVSVENGHLVLAVTNDPITAPVCGGGTKTVQFRCAEINTKGKFQQTYGWFEVRMKFPTAHSLLPGIWLMPAPGHRMIDQDGPGTGDGAEVDIMEHHTGWMGNYVSHALWYGDYGSSLKGGCIGSTYSYIDDVAGWHTYALNWEPGLLEIYVDGVKTQTHTGEGIPFGDEYLIVNMFGGTWGQDIIPEELPAYCLVDYVRIYQKVEGPEPDPEPEPGSGTGSRTRS